MLPIEFRPTRNSIIGNYGSFAPKAVNSSQRVPQLSEDAVRLSLTSSPASSRTSEAARASANPAGPTRGYARKELEIGSEKDFDTSDPRQEIQAPELEEREQDGRTLNEDV